VGGICHGDEGGGGWWRYNSCRHAAQLNSADDNCRRFDDKIGGCSGTLPGRCGLLGRCRTGQYPGTCVPNVRRGRWLQVFSRSFRRGRVSQCDRARSTRSNAGTVAARCSLDCSCGVARSNSRGNRFRLTGDEQPALQKFSSIAPTRCRERSRCFGNSFERGVGLSRAHRPSLVRRCLGRPCSGEGKRRQDNCGDLPALFVLCGGGYSRGSYAVQVLSTYTRTQ
jgi:hypothetical protein